MTPERELRELRQKVQSWHDHNEHVPNAEFNRDFINGAKQAQRTVLLEIDKILTRLAAAPAPTPAPTTNVSDADIFKLACKLVDTASKDRGAFWLPVLSELCQAVIAQQKEIDAIMSRPAEPVVPEREPHRFMPGDYVLVPFTVQQQDGDRVHINVGQGIQRTFLAVDVLPREATAPLAAGGQRELVAKMRETAKRAESGKITGSLRYELTKFADELEALAATEQGKWKGEGEGKREARKPSNTNDGS